MRAGREIAIVCRDRIQFTKWTLERGAKQAFAQSRAELGDTVYHCLTYGCASAGRRFDEIIAIEKPTTEQETEWLREFRLLKLMPR